MLLATSFASNAQEQPKTFGKYPLVANEYGVVNCATTENEKILQENNSKRRTVAQFEEWMSKKIKERRIQKTQKSGNNIMTIPVVVHVLYNNNTQNIPLGQIESQIAVLNEDYRKMAGTNGEDFTGLGVDTQIEFCLAKIDINGDTFDGVDRVFVVNNSFTSRQDIEAMKMQTSWDPTKYFNIWTAAMSGGLNTLLGYAQFPDDSELQGLNSFGGDALTDGVVISYKNFGSSQKFTSSVFQAPNNLGRTATHEIGHALGLRHIWGDETDCTGNDYCADTPTAGGPSSGCPVGADTCPSNGADLVQDYMDYSVDGCMSVFTEDQLERMLTVLENSPRRKELLTSTVCGTLSTPDQQLLEGTKVYPNPTQTVLNITVENGELPDSYVIYNSIGQLVANTKVGSQADLTINTSGYSNGIYFIKVDKGNATKTIKFIKN